MKAARIDGIPLHVVLVHFPVAAWSAATALHFASLLVSGDSLATAAWYLNATGVVTGAVAAVAGALEFVLLPDDPPVRDLAVRHLLYAGSAWAAYAAALLLHGPTLVASSLHAAGFLLLVVAGHAGARLIFHHGIPR